MQKLSGKTAIVTGASSGIGEAIAHSLAQAGVKVALMARREDRIAALAKQLKDAGGEAIAIKCDVADYSSISQAVAQTVQTWERVDILVNNAGVMYLGSVSDANVADWEQMMRINVLGLMYCTRLVLPVMKQHGGGDIINISSVSGRVVSNRSAAYSATKFAVNGFSEGLRQEVFKDKIRITVIEPGAVATELTDHIPDPSLKKTVKDWVATMTPLQSEDIANAVLYAASQPANVSINEIMIRPTEQLM